MTPPKFYAGADPFRPPDEEDKPPKVIFYESESAYDGEPVARYRYYDDEPRFPWTTGLLVPNGYMVLPPRCSYLEKVAENKNRRMVKRLKGLK